MGDKCKIALIFYSIIFLLSSCADERFEAKDINCLYRGGVIYEREDFNKSYAIKYKGEIIRYVKYFEIDNDYRAGDTINKPCIK